MAEKTLAPGTVCIGIAAVSRNGVIGHEGKIAVRHPQDLSWFRDVTQGRRYLFGLPPVKKGALLVGRKTYQEIADVVKDRTIIVLSKQGCWIGENAYCVDSVETLSELVRKLRLDTVFVAGGASVYSAMKDYIHYFLKTRLDTDAVGDTVFPLAFTEQQLLYNIDLGGQPRAVVDVVRL